MKFKLLALLLLITLGLAARPVKVTRVIDGDTFIIETGERVRMLGINAPEMKTVYGEPAKEHLLALINGKMVELEPDHISKDKDVYGRLLRYVYLDGIDIDKQMVRDGYAIAFLKYPFDKQEEYRQEEIKAKAASLGIWQGEDGGGSTSRPVNSTAVVVGVAIILIILVLIIIARRRKK